MFNIRIRIVFFHYKFWYTHYEWNRKFIVLCLIHMNVISPNKINRWTFFQYGFRFILVVRNFSVDKVIFQSLVGYFTSLDWQYHLLACIFYTGLWACIFSVIICFGNLILVGNHKTLCFWVQIPVSEPNVRGLFV